MGDSAFLRCALTTLQIFCILQQQIYNKYITTLPDLQLPGRSIILVVQFCSLLAFTANIKVDAIKKFYVGII